MVRKNMISLPNRTKINHTIILMLEKPSDRKKYKSQRCNNKIMNNRNRNKSNLWDWMTNKNEGKNHLKVKKAKNIRRKIKRIKSKRNKKKKSINRNVDNNIQIKVIAKDKIKENKKRVEHKREEIEVIVIALMAKEKESVKWEVSQIVDQEAEADIKKVKIKARNRVNEKDINLFKIAIY